MDKEKEIEEMRKIVQDNACENLADGYVNTIDDDILALYNAGYRKADEVKKETAKKIFEQLLKIGNADYLCGLPNPNKGFVSVGILKAWAIEYDLEVE